MKRNVDLSCNQSFEDLNNLKKLQCYRNKHCLVNGGVIQCQSKEIAKSQR